MTISIMVLVCWITVGILNVVNCVRNHKCHWLDYWLVYGVLIINLIGKVVEKLV